MDSTTSESVLISSVDVICFRPEKGEVIEREAGVGSCTRPVRMTARLRKWVCGRVDEFEKW